MTYLNPSLAILYEPSHHLVVVVADDAGFRMGNLAGRNCQIELRLVVGRGGEWRCGVGWMLMLARMASWWWLVEYE
jgi:hypothetical protein